MTGRQAGTESRAVHPCESLAWKNCLKQEYLPGCARYRKEVTEQRKIQRREQELATSRMTLQDFLKKQEDEKRELRLILKSDVQGSLEAILQALGKMDTDEVEIKVLHSGVGAVIESDIMLAKASDARVLGFNVRPDANARNVAEAEGVEIRTYRIIYELLKTLMVKGLTKPKFAKSLGRVEVRATFRVPREPWQVVTSQAAK